MLIDKNSDTPIFEQIAQNIISEVLDGSLKAGDRVLSVRQLAVRLAVNPNTIQKSYAGLLAEGILCSQKGRGNFIAENINTFRLEKKKEIIGKLKKLTWEAKQAGLWIDELLSAVDAAYSEK